MKKSVFPYLLLFCVWIPMSWGSILDDDTTLDGYLGIGEYETSYIVVEGSEQLFVVGGGAERITTKDTSYLEVQYTSTPLSNSSGIYDIFVDDNSELLYLGGITQEITLYDSATAHLKGGRIDGITMFRRPDQWCEAIIYCRENWSWVYNSSEQIKGITGLWADGTDFDILFVDVGDPYPPTWENINIVIIPEPATLALLALGGLLIRRYK